VVVHYISLLIVPHPGRLTLDYDFTISRSLFDPLTTAVCTAVKSPNKARVRANLAEALLDARDPGGALREYRRARELDPRLIEPLSAEALIHLTYYNDTATARALLEEATRPLT
jgi:hypothetical protein